MAEKTFFVARFQDPAVLHHHADSATELEAAKQPFHGRRKHFGTFDFPAELHKIFLVVVAGEVGCGGRGLGNLVIHWRDRIAVNFHRQGDDYVFDTER
jgi:hypothetical protein